MSALSSVGDSLWIAVVMIGDWKAIAAAYRAVSDIVAGGKFLCRFFLRIERSI